MRSVERRGERPVSPGATPRSGKRGIPVRPLGCAIACGVGLGVIAAGWGCGAPQRAAPIDADHEQEVLLRCAVAALAGRGFEVAPRVAELTRVSTEWEVQDARRHRVVVTTAFRPDFGPALTVWAATEVRVPAQALTSDGPLPERDQVPLGEEAAGDLRATTWGWEDAGSSAMQRALERELTIEITGCWREQRNVVAE